MTEQKYGKITVGVGTNEMRDLSVTDFVRATYIDGRHVSICSIEDGSISVSVENLVSTGRAPQANIWLSKESLLAVLSTAFIYFDLKDVDLKKLFEETVNGGKIDYQFSDNLKK